MASIEKHPLPLLEPAVIERLLGMTSRFPIPIVEVPPEGDCVRIGRSNPQKPPREFEILEGSRGFALRLGELLERLYRDGAEPGSVTIGLDKDGDPVAKPRHPPGPRRTRSVTTVSTATDSVSCQLPHDIQLTIFNTSSRLNLRTAGDYLAEAMRHFKARNACDGGSPYFGPYRRWAFERDKVVGVLELTTTSTDKRMPALWVEAIVFAYTRLTTVEQLLRASKHGKGMRDRSAVYLQLVQDASGKSNGDLLAFAAVVNRDMKS